MKSIKFFFLAVIVSFLIGACAAPKISYDYDETVDFNRYKTFVLSHRVMLNLKPLDSARFINALANALSKKGISSAKKAALIINITRQEKEAQSHSQIGVGVAQQSRHVGFNIGGAIPIKRNATTQSITLDFREAVSHKLIWQSHIRNTYKNTLTPQEKEKMYFELFTEIFKAYPPKKSG
ncbi:MAG: DUF4136 domain-containing protein [Flavobacteriaceae bacterium]|nr:DUF4136 domain-containing protein [Flavobacteriaceae bacterium]